MIFLDKVDRFLDRITMYRLVFQLLVILYFISLVFSFFDLIPFSPLDLLVSGAVFLGSCAVSNKIFSRIFNAPTNLESAYITALILTLIVSPSASLNDIWQIFLIGVLAMASKYILTFNRKHIFNPAVMAVVIAAIIGFQSASWWIGNYYMAPFILIAGILIVRKIRFKYLVLAFLCTYLVIAIGLGIISGADPLGFSEQILFNSYLLFFAFIMLTEPLTLPPTRKFKIFYGILVGVLSVPQLSFGSVYLMPEHALIIGNVFSFILSSRQKLILEIKSRKKLSKYAMELVFSPVKKFNYKPGQYMEWTLPHKKPDARGVRRFFTIASSPTEENIRLGINFAGEEGSTYKKYLEKFEGRIVASNLDGEFVLPNDRSKKIAFIAGGIGITPIRSIVKYLLDKDEKRDIVLIYSNSTEDELTYKEVFDDASKKLGTKVVYTLTKDTPLGWKGRKGRVDEDMIKAEIPDYKKRIFYVSGSQPLVSKMKENLRQLGVSEHFIKTDYFPGLT